MKKECLPIHNYPTLPFSNLQWQAKSGELENKIARSIFPYKDANAQISKVVRMMFQDSKGNIGFGAENGAWKLTGHSLVHIDSTLLINQIFHLTCMVLKR